MKVPDYQRLSEVGGGVLSRPYGRDRDPLWGTHQQNP